MSAPSSVLNIKLLVRILTRSQQGRTISISNEIKKLSFNDNFEIEDLDSH